MQHIRSMVIRVCFHPVISRCTPTQWSGVATFAEPQLNRAWKPKPDEWCQAAERHKANPLDDPALRKRTSSQLQGWLQYMETNSRPLMWEHKQHHVILTIDCGTSGL